MMPGGFALMVMMPIAGQITRYLQPKYWMAIGLGAVALGMWYSTSLPPDPTFHFFAMMQVYQTFGLPLLFLPINIVAYAELPEGKTNQGSALINVARNLGRSVGVSLVNTELLQRSQFHVTRLVSSLFASSPALETTMRELTRYFDSYGSPTDAAQRAMDYVWHVVGTQAAIMAYIDVFHTWAIFALSLIPAALVLMRRVDRTVPRSPSMH